MMHPLPPAHFGKRALATLLDGFVLSIVTFTIAGVFDLKRFHSDGLEQILKFLYVLLLPLFWYGYTVGKRLLNIRIVQKDGSSLSFSRSFLRTIGSLLYLVPTFIGFALSFGFNVQTFPEQITQFLITSQHPPLSFIGGILGTFAMFTASVCMVAFRKDGRAIHDFIGGTFVINDKPEKKQP